MTPVATKPGIGHNSGLAPAKLMSFVERIERIAGEQAALAEDKREVYAEAKGEGFDTWAIRKLVALRKLEAAERKEKAELLDTYASACGLGDIFM